MAYTKTTETGYVDRLKSSCSGVIIGIILIIGGTSVLWWNEGRAVKTADMLENAQKVAVEMEDINKIDAGLNGKLVHATGECMTNDSLVDDKFQVGTIGIRLVRKVEYYQWVEHSETTTEEKMGGKQVETTTYTYKKEWVDEPIESSDFADPKYQGRNFTLTEAEDEDFLATNVTFGAYTFPKALIEKVSGYERYNINIDDKVLEGMDRNIAQVRDGVAAPTEEPAETADAETEEPTDSVAEEPAAATTPAVTKDLKYVHISGNVLYFGLTPGAPSVGDVRISFERVMPATVSILACVNGSTFESHRDDNGKSLLALRMGTHSMDSMFEMEENDNMLLTWGLRIICTIAICVGFMLLFAPIAALFNFIPFLAHLAGTGLNIVGLALGLAWSLVVFVLAWLFARPILAICLLVLLVAVIGGGVFLAIKFFKKK